MNIDKADSVTATRRYRITKYVSVDGQLFRATTDAGGATDQGIFGMLTAAVGETVEYQITATVLGRGAKERDTQRGSVRNADGPLSAVIRLHLRADRYTHCDRAWRESVVREFGSGSHSSVSKTLSYGVAAGVFERKPGVRGWYRIVRQHETT